MSEKIYITNHDQRELKELLTTQISNAEALGPHVRKLENEIRKAMVIQDEQVNPDLITMDSHVRISLDGSDMELWLVYPKDADVNENKVSVLSPIGTAILGYSKGDVIQWEVPSGNTEIHIVDILYQPESAWADDDADK